MDEQQLRAAFERLVANLFSAEGFEVTIEARAPDQRTVVDLLIRSPSGATAAAELKLYHSRITPITVLQRAAAVAEFGRQSFGATKAILVIGNTVSELARTTLRRKHPDLVLYDLDTLAFLVANHPNLIGTFQDINRQTLAFSEPVEPKPRTVNIEEDMNRPPEAPAPAVERILKGHDLCEDLRLIPPGREHFGQFQDKVTEAVRYIFDQDLTAWSPQKTTDTGISVYDLIGRVSSKHDFWNFIVNHFRSRYIIFEFKNYTDALAA
jgi:restriction endonuclease